MCLTIHNETLLKHCKSYCVLMISNCVPSHQWDDFTFTPLHFIINPHQYHLTCGGVHIHHCGIISREFMKNKCFRFCSDLIGREMTHHSQGCMEGIQVHNYYSIGRITFEIICIKPCEWIWKGIGMWPMNSAHSINTGCSFVESTRRGIVFWISISGHTG